jgi:competence protein ComEA
MLKKILLAMALFYAALSYAAVDVNKASAAQLDGIKGIGPAKSAAIMGERKKGDFKDWNDFITRVPGIGEVNASKLSEAGLTVGSASYKAPAKADAAKTVEKKDTKTTAVKEEPKKAETKKEEPKKTEAKKEEPKKDDKIAAAKPAASAPKK